MPTVISDWISDGAKEEIAQQKVKDEDLLLGLIESDPKATLSTLANKMGWKLFSGEPNKMKAKRALAPMKGAKLIKETRTGNYRLTDEGRAVLKGEK